MGYPRAGIRWRDDTGWELRCPDCAARGQHTSYWPLTDEFWDRHMMARCRACERARLNRRDREKYAADPAERARRNAAARAYRAESADVLRIKKRQRRPLEAARSRARYWADPEKRRARQRELYAARKAA